MSKLQNISNQEIRDAKLEDLAYIFLKQFKKQPNIKITEGILDCFEDRDAEVRNHVNKAIHWLRCERLIKPRVIDGHFTDSHFITRKGLNKLEETQNE